MTVQWGVRYARQRFSSKWVGGINRGVILALESRAKCPRRCDQVRKLLINQPVPALELSAGVPNGKYLGAASVLRRRTNAHKRPALDSQRTRFSSWWLAFKKIGKPQGMLVLRRTSPLRRSRHLAIATISSHRTRHVIKNLLKPITRFTKLNCYSTDPCVWRPDLSEFGWDIGS